MVPTVENWDNEKCPNCKSDMVQLNPEKCDISYCFQLGAYFDREKESKKLTE